jgi:4'-phosphopantetheinyl transferase
MAPLFFNVSQCENLAVIAISRDVELGVDVERIRPMQNMPSIAARFFSADEAAALENLPSDARSEAFFRCWTRKEAVTKAHGSGLSTPLHSFAVPVTPIGLPTVVCFAYDPVSSRYELNDLEPDPDMWAP